MTSVSVKEQADIYRARKEARAVAEGAGFDPVETTKIVTSVSELANNVVKHAGRGEIEVNMEGSSLKIVCRDEGPGIKDVEEAISSESRSTGDGLGIGLGGVQRMMDDLSIESSQAGTTVTAIKRGAAESNEAEARGASERQLTYGAATRPAEGSIYNGDTYVVREISGQALVSIVDGLGSGIEALKASRKAGDYMQSHSERMPEDLIKGCHEALQGTRGAVLSVAKVLPSENSLVFAGVGDIRTKILRHNGRTPVSTPGIVGYNLDDVNQVEISFEPGNILVMHSDGVSSHTRLLEAEEIPPKEAAEEILEKHGKPDDDATVLIARYTDD